MPRPARARAKPSKRGSVSVSSITTRLFPTQARPQAPSSPAIAQRLERARAEADARGDLERSRAVSTSRSRRWRAMHAREGREDQAAAVRAVSGSTRAWPRARAARAGRELAPRQRAVVVADQMTMAETSAEEIIATCSAEFGIQIVPGVFISAELTRPITATSAPGQRPAMRGGQHDGRNEEDEGDPGLGDRENRPVQARRPARPGRLQRRSGAATIFSIHGHRRASRESLDFSARPADPPSTLLRVSEDYPSFSAERPAAAGRRCCGRASSIQAHSGACAVQMVAPGFIKLRVVERAIAHDDQVRA